MKHKIVAALTVAATLFTASPAMAQGVKFGLKGGMNNTEMKFDKSVFDSSNRFGWFIGPTVKVSLPVSWLGFDIAALYDQRDLKVNGEGIQQKSIIVPVNARLGFGLGSTAGLYVAAGPQFGFNVGADEFSWKDANSYENTFQLKKSAFSINLGAGVYITEHVELGFTYNIALGKTADASLKDAIDAATTKSTYNDDTKAKAWTVSACYYF